MKFEARVVIEIYNALQALDIRIWLDGGWGVDALLGEETREHSDLDIVIQAKDLSTFNEYMHGRGYREILRDDSSSWNYVLSDKDAHEVDVHVITFDEDGNGLYGPSDRGIFYPADAFSGHGFINGVRVECLSAEYQVISHTGYRLSEKDYNDVLALCKKFDLTIPEEYL